jgi:hypothetical protein
MEYVVFCIVAPLFLTGGEDDFPSLRPLASQNNRDAQSVRMSSMRSINHDEPEARTDNCRIGARPRGFDARPIGFRVAFQPPLVFDPRLPDDERLAPHIRQNS